MTTLRVAGTVVRVIFGATLFVGFYVVADDGDPDRVLGMFLNWVSILPLAVPIFVPLMSSLNFDGVFGLPGVPPGDLALGFGVIYMVNMQMSFLSPPLFYLRSVAPPAVTMAQICRSSLPFLALQTIGLGSASSFRTWCCGCRG